MALEEPAERREYFLVLCVQPHCYNWSDWRFVGAVQHRLMELTDEVLLYFFQVKYEFSSGWDFDPLQY